MATVDVNPSRWLPISDGARVSESNDERKINDGLSWQGIYNETVGTGTSVTVMLTAPASGTFETFFRVQSDKAITWEFGEAPNASGGSTITGYNHHRSSINTDPIGALVSGVTYTSSGTILAKGVVGSAGNPNSTQGGSGTSAEKWILEASTAYIIKVDAGAADTNVLVSVHYDLQE